MFEAYKIGVAISLTNHVSPSLAQLAQDFAATNKEAVLFQRRIDSIKSSLIGGLMIAGLGAGLASLFKTPINKALEFERALLRIKNIGGINSDVLSGVRNDALSGKYKGIDAIESVNLFRDLHAAFGDAEHAKQFMPQFVDMARITRGMYGKSALASEQDVQAIAKFAERRGGTASIEMMGSAIDTAMRIQNASGGAVTPKDLLAFTTRMGAMGNQMSDIGILKMWALMQEQGGSKAGTALNSAQQNLFNGKSTEKAGFWLHEIGLVDEAKNNKMLEKIHGASAFKHRNEVTGNSLIGAAQGREDFVGWVAETALPKIVSYVHKQGVTDEKKVNSKVTEILSMALSNRLGADEVSLIATQLPRILKDFHLAEDSSGLAGSKKAYDESPLKKMQDLHSNWDTALTNLGESALPILIPNVNNLAEKFKSLNQFASENPKVIEGVTNGLWGMSKALLSIGALKAFNGVINSIGVGIDLWKSNSKVAKVEFYEGARGLGLITTAANLASAAFLGWQLGTWFNDTFIAGTKFSNWLGETIATLLSWVGFGEAKEALAANNKASGSPYVKPSHGQPIQVSTQLNMDGRKVASLVSMHQGREAARPLVSGSQFDSNMNLLSPSFGK
ncbi:hypothetical protein ACO0K2_17720 [Undibacterium sp. MH2W]|uniref:hypothetical protein n=1 Tax=Undibacterium sp. MH2W TaxID=3413044 RepID=UPI003BF119B9